jgi:hypothetical protein
MVADSLDALLSGLYSELAELYADSSIENTDKIAKIKAINEKIAHIRSNPELDPELRKKGDRVFEYAPQLGIYIDTTTKDKDGKTQKDRYEEYKNSTDKEGAAAVSVRTKSREGRLGSFEKEILKSLPIYNKNLPVNKQAPYSTIHVEFSSGVKVVAGINEFTKFLEQNKPNIANEIPVTFVDLIINPKDENHFVCYHIIGNKVIYTDSNGEKMPSAQREVIRKLFPQAEVEYISGEALKKNPKATTEDLKNGRLELINERDFDKRSPEIYRCQFDSTSCGAYAGEIAKLMQAANGDEASIVSGLQRIKAINPLELRENHSKDLAQIVARDDVAAVRHLMQQTQQNQPAEQNTHTNTLAERAERNNLGRAKL